MGLNLQKTNSCFFFTFSCTFFPPSSRERNASFAEARASKMTQIVLTTVIILSAGRKIAGTIQAWSGTISSFWVWSRPQSQPVQELPDYEKNSSRSPVESWLLKTKTVDASNRDGNISALCCSHVDGKLRKLCDGLILALLARVWGFEDMCIVQSGSWLGGPLCLCETKSFCLLKGAACKNCRKR